MGQFTFFKDSKNPLNRTFAALCCIAGARAFVVRQGLEAASLTSLVKYMIKAYAYLEQSPALVINKTNVVVSKVSPRLVTVFFGILDTSVKNWFIVMPANYQNSHADENVKSG